MKTWCFEVYFSVSFYVLHRFLTYKAPHRVKRLDRFAFLNSLPLLHAVLLLLLLTVSSSTSSEPPSSVIGFQDMQRTIVAEFVFKDQARRVRFEDRATWDTAETMSSPTCTSGRSMAARPVARTGCSCERG